MTNRTIVWLKGIVFAVCLLPFLRAAWLYGQVASGVAPNALGADPVKTLTHFTGNWTLRFLLLSLAITPVRRLSPGIAWLIRFRRMIGLFAFFYGTVHLCIYLFLFSGYDFKSAWAGLKSGHLAVLFANFADVWPTLIEDVTKYNYVLVGFACWLILLALAITSPMGVLRKMGGKAWQRLHSLIYLAGFLALMHFWWSLAKGSGNPVADTIVFFALIFARIGWWLLKKRRASARAAQAA